MSNPPVLLASDHRGFHLKAQLSAWLVEHGFTAVDLGTNSEERCDAHDFARKLAEDITANPGKMGVLICGSGLAMSMTANRYKALRAALCTDVTMARASREHNDANVLVLGADIIGSGVAVDCLEAFMKTKFLGGRYAERRDKLTGIGGL